MSSTLPQELLLLVLEYLTREQLFILAQVHPKLEETINFYLKLYFPNFPGSYSLIEKLLQYHKVIRPIVQDWSDEIEKRAMESICSFIYPSPPLTVILEDNGAYSRIMPDIALVPFGMTGIGNQVYTIGIVQNFVESYEQKKPFCFDSDIVRTQQGPVKRPPGAVRAYHEFFSPAELPQLLDNIKRAGYLPANQIKWISKKKIKKHPHLFHQTDYR